MTLPIPIFRKAFVRSGIRCRVYDNTISVSNGNTFLYMFHHPDEGIVSCKTMIAF